MRLLAPAEAVVDFKAMIPKEIKKPVDSRYLELAYLE